MFLRGFGIPFLFVFTIAPLVLGVIALVDATRRSDDEWARAGQNRTLWIVLIAVGFVTCFIGVAIDLIYLVSIRPQLDRVVFGSGPASAFAAGPQAGWYPDPYARHELRYFDGRGWSENVSDAGVPTIDPAR